MRPAPGSEPSPPRRPHAAADCSAVGRVCEDKCCSKLQCVTRTSWQGNDVCLGALRLLHDICTPCAKPGHGMCNAKAAAARPPAFVVACSVCLVQSRHTSSCSAIAAPCTRSCSSHAARNAVASNAALNPPHGVQRARVLAISARRQRTAARAPCAQMAHARGVRLVRSSARISQAPPTVLRRQFFVW